MVLKEYIDNLLLVLRTNLDKITHFLFVYMFLDIMLMFSNYYVAILSVSLLIFTKEYADPTFDKKDIYAGFCGIIFYIFLKVII